MLKAYDGRFGVLPIFDGRKIRKEQKKAGLDNFLC